MADYIVYCLNEAGSIWRSEWIAAVNDADALAKARAMELPNGCEIWEKERFVSRVGAGSAERGRAAAS